MTKDEVQQLLGLIGSPKWKSIEPEVRTQLIQDLNRFNEVGEIDETPYVLPPWRGTIQGGPLTGMPRNIEWSKPQIAAAKNGIDVEAGLPEDLRQILSLSIDDENRQAAIENYYSNKGQKTWVGMDPTIGLVYLNPTTKRLTSVKGKDTILDWNPTVGGTLDAAGQVIGGGGGALVGSATSTPGLGTFFGTIAGSMLGQAGSETAKRGIDFAMGNPANPIASEAQRAETSGKNIGEMGAYSAGGEVAFMIPRGAWKWFKQGLKPLTYKQAAYIKNAIADSDETIQLYNQMFPDNPINANALVQAYLSGDGARKEYLAPFVQKYMAKVAADPSTATKQAEQTMQNLTALEQTLKDVSERFRPRGLVSKEDPYKGDRLFRDEMLAQTDQAKTTQKAAFDVAKAQRRAAIADLPDYTEVESGQGVKRLVGQAYDAATKAETAAWNGFKKQLGARDEIISDSRLVRASHEPADTVRIEVDQQLKDDISRYIRQARRENITSAGKFAPQEALPEMMLGRDATGNRTVLQNVKSWDSYQIYKYLKELRLGVRRQNAAKNNFVFSADDEKQVATIFEDYLYRQWRKVGRGDLVDAYEQAKFATQQKKDLFEESVLRDLLPDANGKIKATDYQAVAHTFYRNDPAAASQLRTVLDGSPEAIQEVRNMLLSMYKSNPSYTKHGVPTRDGLEKFKRDYGQAIYEFFGPQEYDKLTRLGQMDEAVLAAKENLDSWKARWNKVPLSKYGKSPNSISLSASVLNDEKVSPETINSAVVFLRNSQPELLQAAQYSTARRFAAKVTSPDGSPNVQAMEKILSTRGEHLRAMLGEEWYRNIRMLQATIRQFDSRRLAHFNAKDEIPTLRMMMRMFVPPLSQEGRVVSAAVTNRKQAAARVWYNAVSDPHSLSIYMRNLQLDPRSTAGAGVLTALGASSFNDNPEDKGMK